MAAFSDFTLILTRSDNFLILFTVTVDGVATNITAWQEFWFTAKRRPADPDAVAVFRKTKTAGAITITNGAAGIAQLALVPADTSQLSNARQTLFCELSGKDAAGAIWTLSAGKLVVSPEIQVSTT